ncbi:helix-turn-helix transcriptional regulator [Clostridium sp. 19966]|uniref:helix-turn-helix transcriptional regulator n=1 Tax=Clostridium sp. 19966 TaxID=2768166 RepID=UPI0028E01B76|nr:helix-turn-helix transcriptional regulator [Clostridium sp. 19966]MDT8719332.1 helix-turn-helix transcriptional regulator [Clostridium sp. 19966]
MECCNVIPIGDKLRRLRDKYNLNQDEIVGTDVTRNLISQIENGKAKLTRSTAEIIMSHVKEILNKRNMTPDIDIEYLLESEETQANKILDEFIEELKNSISNNATSVVDTLKQAEEFMLKWDFIDKKIRICELAGDYFYNNNDFYKASVYYENVKCLVNLNMDMVLLVPVLKKLSETYFYIGKYQEGIDVCDYAIDRFPKIDNGYKAGFLFNSSLYYNYMKEYEKSIRFIEELQGILNKDSVEKYIKILLLKASCLYHLKLYDEALKIYGELLEVTPNDDYGHKAIYYNNLSDIYIELEKLDKANEYLNMALEIIPDISMDFDMLPQMHLDIAKRYTKLAQRENTISFLKKALKLAKDFRYSFVVNDILVEFLHISHCEAEIDIKDEFIELVRELGSINDLLLVNILQYFAALNDTNSVIEICEFCKGYLENI